MGEALAAATTARVEGHLGEILQGRLGPGGTLALVTLPCPPLVARARCRPGPLALAGPPVIDLAGLRDLLAAAGAATGGRFCLSLGMPPGGGAGASTAARVALLRAAGVESTTAIAGACLASEGASDPLMFPDPGRILWASREGRVLARLPRLPAMEIVGGFFGPPCRTAPDDLRFPDVSDLVARLDGGLATLGAAAAASAARTLALRGPDDDPTAALARDLGAVGFAIGHTGPARALIFPPGAAPAGAEEALRRAGFSRITRYRIGGSLPA